MRQIVERVLGSSCEIKAIAVVKVYTASNSPSWEYAKIVGLAALLRNTKENTNYIHVINVSDNTVALSQELYENFNYESTKEFFHTFEMDDCVAGLSFADNTEAAHFLEAVKACAGASHHQHFERTTSAKPALPPRPQSAKPLPIPPPAAPATPPPVSASEDVPPPPPVGTPPSPSVVPDTPTTPRGSTPADKGDQKSADKRTVEKKKTSFFKKIMSTITGNDIPEDFAISDPHGFRHESHIGWDPERGFEIRNIPPEWRKLFQAAGVKKSELKDAETAKFVMNVIGETIATSSAPAIAPSTPALSSVSAPAVVAPPSVVPSSGATPPPPPPPVSKGPSPPPPPPTMKAPPSGAASGSRADLLKSIQQGKELRKVEPGSLPDLKALNPNESRYLFRNLVDTLASAMAARRVAMQAHGDDEDDDQPAEEEEWSD
jgi:hypothetical protein